MISSASIGKKACAANPSCLDRIEYFPQQSSDKSIRLWFEMGSSECFRLFESFRCPHLREQSLGVLMYFNTQREFSLN